MGCNAVSVKNRKFGSFKEPHDTHLFDSDEDYRVEDPRGTPDYKRGKNNLLIIENESETWNIVCLKL